MKQIKYWLYEKIVSEPRIYDLYQKIKNKQTEESLFLSKAFNDFSKPFNIIQIGANDGLRDDPVRKFVIANDCNALFIEADPICFNMLCENYKYIKKSNFKFRNFAIVPNKTKPYIFYSLSEKFRKMTPKREQITLSRKASTNKELFSKHLFAAGINNLDEAISEQEVESKSINQIFKEYLLPDILIIDTEGLDWELLASLDISYHKPKYIYFESRHCSDLSIKKDVTNKFRNEGYELINFEYNIGMKLLS